MVIRRILTCGMFGLLLVISTTACGGDDTTGGPAGPSGPATTADPDGATTTRPTASTAAPATTTTTTPPYSFDGSVPPPDLVNTGTDYVAIAESLFGYVTWLKRHDPDSSRLRAVYVPGTELSRRFGRDLDLLAESNHRYVDVDQQLEFVVVSADADLVTLTLREHIAAERLVDSTGTVIEERPTGPVNGYVVLMAADARGRWRLAEISLSTADARVQL